MTVYVLHQYKYWTEYLGFLLEDPHQFQLIASEKAREPFSSTEPLESLEVFDPLKHETIVTAGALKEDTCANNVIMRMMHSPGFNVYPLLRAYASLVTNHMDSDYMFLVSEAYYEALKSKKFNEKELEHFKHQILGDPKVGLLKVDVNMVEVARAPRVRNREKGTGFLALTWLSIYEGIDFVLNVVKSLGKKIELDLLLHPLVRFDEDFCKKIKEGEGKFYRKAYYNLSRPQLIDRFDSYEYIITDGSGSCYEAMLRGCKPYIVKGVRTVPVVETYEVGVDENYLPFPEYDKIGQVEYSDSGKFIEEHFPYTTLMDVDQAKAIAKKEVLDAVDKLNMHHS